MSRENVQIVQAGLDAWNAGDMVALREFYATDLVVHPPENWPEPGPFVGRDAAMRQFEQVRSAWDADRLNLVEALVDAGDRVVGRLIWEGLGHGPTAAMEMTVVWTVRNGAICHMKYFWDYAEALAAVGVRD